MNYSSTYRFTLDMHSAQSQISIPCVLGDTNRQLRINLSDGSKPYYIEDGCMAMIGIRNPVTGRFVNQFCHIEGNATIVYPFGSSTSCEVGIHECDITLFDLNYNVITTPRFTMVVSDRVVPNDAIVVTPEDQTAVDAMLAKEAERQAAENERQDKEAERQTCELDRIEAEKIRSNAEDERIANEEARITAGETALAAAARAQEAKERCEEIVGDIDTALDTIIAVQENLIGSEVSEDEDI